MKELDIDQMNDRKVVALILESNGYQVNYKCDNTILEYGEK